jgi:hypothetical protein
MGIMKRILPISRAKLESEAWVVRPPRPVRGIALLFLKNYSARIWIGII